MHVQEFHCFYSLINKQITSNHIFGISEVCNMDQEVEIFKLRGTQNDFLTRSTARGSHIGGALVVFFVFVK